MNGKQELGGPGFDAGTSLADKIGIVWTLLLLIDVGVFFWSMCGRGNNFMFGVSLWGFVVLILVAMVSHMFRDDQSS